MHFSAWLFLVFHAGIEKKQNWREHSLAKKLLGCQVEGCTKFWALVGCIYFLYVVLAFQLIGLCNFYVC